MGAIMRIEEEGPQIATITEAERRRFRNYYHNVDTFIDDVLCGHLVTLDNVTDFVPGCEPVLFYEDYIRLSL